VVTLFSSLAHNLFHRTRVEQELDQEVRAYIELLADEKIRGGVSPEEAHRLALVEFGSVEQVKERVRDGRIGNLIESMFKDVRHALRTLAGHPVFTAAALLSLALGIGANAALFSFVNAILLRPLPYVEPERLVRVTGFYPKGALVELQQQSQSMDVAGFTTDSEFNLSWRGQTVHLAGSSVSANLFHLLGAPAAIGRTFHPGEDRAGHDRVVILSYKLWQDRFGGGPDVIGRYLTLDGLERRVVGVMPADFLLPISSAQLWIPLHLDPSDWEDHWGAGFMPVVGRLRPGMKLEQAQDEIKLLVSRIITAFPYPMARAWNSDATVISLPESMAAGVRHSLLTLLGAVGIILLIACANVAGLLLSRAAARRKEMALRASLGAARGRIVRQLLTESAVLALAGGGLGLAIAFAALSAVKSALPADTPRLAEAGLDGEVGLFVTALVILTTFAFGLAPALRASRSDIAALVKGGGWRPAARAGMRLRNSLVSGQVALAFTLALCAGLLIKSLWLLAQVNPGFRPEHVLSTRVFPSQSSCLNRAECIVFYDELLRQVRGVSGVSEVAAENAAPLTGDISAVPVEVENLPLKPAEHLAPMFWAAAITLEYFRVMRIPILEGRAFTAADRADSPGVVLVSTSTARRFWPGESAVGKRLKPVWDEKWRTVVGVAQDVRQYALTSDSPGGTEGVIYMPYPQAVGNNRQLPAAMTLLVRTTADPAQVAGNIRRIVPRLNPVAPVGEVRTMESVVAASTSRPRSMMWIFVGLAGSALLMAAIGVYGIVSYSTSQRIYELGVRAALGATKLDLLSMVLRQSLRLVVIGLALGAIASIALTRTMAGLLYRGRADPATFLAVGLLVIVVALLAGFVPARRAAGVDPVRALRVD
jgi:putative ABC transport system permease protein